MKKWPPGVLLAIYMLIATVIGVAGACYAIYLILDALNTL